MCHCIEGTHRPIAKNTGWVNVQGDVVHPNAPASGYGGGAFRVNETTTPLTALDTLPHPGAPDSRTLDPLHLQEYAEELDAQATKQPAPRVTKDTTSTIQGISVTLAADATGGTFSGAKTVCTPGNSGEITADTVDGKVTKIYDTIVYSAHIQTTYGTGKPDDNSAYGRGTTPDDKKNGNITIGFHEGCHRDDYMSQLKTKKVPKFGGKKDMTEKDFNDAITKYEEDWEKFFEELADHTLAVTDEVGDPTRTKWLAAQTP